MSHHLILIWHLLAATIWVGGHLLLSIRFLPEAFKKKEVAVIVNFKNKFEPIGMPALVILLLTGIIMVYDFGIPVSDWFSFASPMERLVSIKLSLLLLTFVLAINAQLFVFPKLTADKLVPVAFQIIAVTIIGISMLILGSFFRVGGM
mgnify:CR=1 FL=1